MAELPVPVAVDPATGAWTVGGQPVIPVPRHFWTLKTVGSVSSVEAVEPRPHSRRGVQSGRSYLCYSEP